MTLEPMQTALTRSLRQTLAMSPVMRSYFSWGSSSSESEEEASSSLSWACSRGTGGDVGEGSSAEGDGADMGRKRWGCG